MYRRNVVLMLITMVGFIIIGCGGSKQMVRIGSFTVVSTRNIELSKVTDSSRKIKARGVEGTYLVDPEEFDRQGGSGISAAIEDAVNKAAGDFMINCIIYRIEEDGKKGYRVKGDVIQTMAETY